VINARVHAIGHNIISAITVSSYLTRYARARARGMHTVNDSSVNITSCLSMKGIMRYYSPAMREQLNFKQSKSLLLVIIFYNEDYRNYCRCVAIVVVSVVAVLLRDLPRCIFTYFHGQYGQTFGQKIARVLSRDLNDYIKCMKSSHAGHNEFSIFYNTICP